MRPLDATEINRISKSIDKAKEVLLQSNNLPDKGKIAIKIANLFYCYAHPPLFSAHWRSYKPLAYSIAKELYQHPEWNFEQCKNYVNKLIAKVSTPMEGGTLSPMAGGTLYGVLIAMNKLEELAYQNSQGSDKAEYSLTK